MKGVFSLSKLQAEFISYMKIALKHDSIDYFRKFSRKNKIDSISLNDSNIKNVSTSINDVDTFSFNKHNLCEINNYKLRYAMDKLTKRQKDIIILYSNDVTASEISAELNISIGTVYASISQIKNKIKKYMEE